MKIKEKYKVAVIGATGLVGRTMLQVLDDRNFPVEELILVASDRSIGKKISFRDRDYTLCSLSDAIDRKPDFALFSAGSGVSLQWAPKFAEQGITVIDNSSAWRMDPEIPLIVPEVNGNSLKPEDQLIANPNCSTIQAVVALAPLHRQFRLKRLVISTYQSITGTGKLAVEQYKAEKEGRVADMIYPHPIFANCLPHCDVFVEDGYTREEMKLVRETRKILGTQDIGITATAVRVPVVGGHSESINAEFHEDLQLDQVYAALTSAPGVTILDDPENAEYPMPLFVEGKDDVFVGRIRMDHSQANTINLWVVSDNLRKGAATNAIQIAEYLCLHRLSGLSQATEIEKSA